ncbi:MAG TPA: metal-sensitive transcriptional regulator [Ilumatobacteraceae bacterium]|nr:metal-sensitive transcriptional regulator [Ilumatobacteraceae bacterium]
MRFPEDVNDDVVNRLRRLEGQIRGVQRMIEEGQDCRDVVTQLSACKAALDRVGYRLVAAGMRHCALPSDPAAGEAGEGGLDADELERLFMKLS